MHRLLWSIRFWAVWQTVPFPCHHCPFFPIILIRSIQSKQIDAVQRNCWHQSWTTSYYYFFTFFYFHLASARSELIEKHPSHSLKRFDRTVFMDTFSASKKSTITPCWVRIESWSYSKVNFKNIPKKNKK